MAKALHCVNLNENAKLSLDKFELNEKKIKSDGAKSRNLLFYNYIKYLKQTNLIM